MLDDLLNAGHGDVLRVVLSRAPFDIPVVKVFVPGLNPNRLPKAVASKTSYKCLGAVRARADRREVEDGKPEIHIV